MKNSINPLSRLWIEYSGKRHDPDTFNRFAAESDRECRRRLPNGRFGGVLTGREAEIRQDAMILLIQQFLRGNRLLKSATEAGDVDEVECQLQRSISACIFHTIRRHARRACRERKRFVPLESADQLKIDAADSKVITSPEDRSTISNALLLAVNRGWISPRNYRIAEMAFERAIPVHAIALQEGVSSSAIYQQLRRAGPLLARAVRIVHGEEEAR